MKTKIKLKSTRQILLDSNTMNTHMCDSVQDEISSMITQMQTVIRDILRLSQDPDKTKLENYCKCNKRIIQMIIQLGNANETQTAKKEEFASMVQQYIEAE